MIEIKEPLGVFRLLEKKASWRFYISSVLWTISRTNQLIVNKWTEGWISVGQLWFWLVLFVFCFFFCLFFFVFFRVWKDFFPPLCVHVFLKPSHILLLFQTHDIYLYFVWKKDKEICTFFSFSVTVQYFTSLTKEGNAVIYKGKICWSHIFSSKQDRIIYCYLICSFSCNWPPISLMKGFLLTFFFFNFFFMCFNRNRNPLWDKMPSSTRWRRLGLLRNSSLFFPFDLNQNYI